MGIEGYNEEQIVETIEKWRLGAPIDVEAFFGRADIPAAAKDRVHEAGMNGRREGKSEAEAYRLLVAQVIIEVVHLERQLGHA